MTVGIIIGIVSPHDDKPTHSSVVAHGLSCTIDAPLTGPKLRNALASEWSTHLAHVWFQCAPTLVTDHSLFVLVPFSLPFLSSTALPSPPFSQPLFLPHCRPRIFHMQISTTIIPTTIEESPLLM